MARREICNNNKKYIYDISFSIRAHSFFFKQKRNYSPTQSTLGGFCFPPSCNLPQGSRHFTLHWFQHHTYTISLAFIPIRKGTGWMLAVSLTIAATTRCFCNQWVGLCISVLYRVLVDCCSLFYTQHTAQYHQCEVECLYTRKSKPITGRNRKIHNDNNMAFLKQFAWFIYSFSHTRKIYTIYTSMSTQRPNHQKLLLIQQNTDGSHHVLHSQNTDTYAIGNLARFKRCKHPPQHALSSNK